MRPKRTAVPKYRQDLDHDQVPNTGTTAMTSRGTKYWNSGSIPLIAPEILGNIIAEVADLGIVISSEGHVLSVLVNPLYDSFKSFERFENRDIRTILTTESIPKFESRLAAFLREDENVKPVELNHASATGRWEFPIRYSFHSIGPDGAILMLGRDLRPVAEMQQQLVQAQIALEQDYETQREHDTRFRVLMENTTDAMVFVSAHSGLITEANHIAANLLESNRDSLVGRHFADSFAVRKAGDLVADMTTQAIAETDTPVTATLRKSGVDLLMTPTLFRAAGERVLLCRIAPKDETAVRPDDLSANLRGLYKSSTDAIVFTTDDGTIMSANDGFLNLIDIAHDISVRGNNLANYLQRGTVDVKVMAENAARNGKMRFYATRVAGDYGSPRAVDISVSQIMAGKTPLLAYVIRENTGSDTAREATGATAEDTMQSVKELVGQATLRDIVAETTNVVEKMCIETAVALTMNNRVAAAEMLGLSRQSLYVKLRKFNLLSRDGTAGE